MDAGYGLSMCGQSWRDCPRADNPARLVRGLTIAGRRILPSRSLKGTEGARCPFKSSCRLQVSGLYSKPLCRGTSHLGSTPVKKLIRPLSAALATALILSACAGSDSAPADAVNTADGLDGAWRSQIRFSSGAFAPIKDLEFMYVFNHGGTLTES